MVKVLSVEDENFEQSLNDFIEISHNTNTQVISDVAKIIKDVAEKGDKSLIEYTNKFDHTDFSAADLKVSKEEIEQGYNNTSKETIKALEFAAKRIEDYHKQQMPEDKLFSDELGVKLGWKWTAIDAVGLYVPGGTATYPSSVLMNAIPAKVAGAERLVIVSPTPNGKSNDVILAAAKIAGVDEIYKVGGAQSISALAYGTETIKPVSKIVGPGNAYVAEAKKQVFGKVGIDMIAGPSEILVISDGSTDPEWIAADLLSQAEHDTDSRSILVTDNEDFAHHVIGKVDELIETLDRKEIAKDSWGNNGAVIITSNLDQAAEIANKIAAEHLELAVENPEALEKKIKNAGAIFLGSYTPEAIGDYTAGPSHVLPTAGSAKFSSGLSVFDFIKRSSIISCDQNSFRALKDSTEHLANEEGLNAHALSVSIRD